MTNDKDNEYIQSTINNKLNNWLNFNNQLLGFFGIGLAYASLGMKDPSFFATWSLVFIFGAWLPTAIKMKVILDISKKENNPLIGYKNILLMGFPYVFGLLTLLLVALGKLTNEATFNNILPGL